MRSAKLGAMTILVMLTIIGQGQGLTAYDCKHPNTKHVTLDLTEPGPCPEPTTDYEDPRKEYLQVIRTEVNAAIIGYHCTVSATKTVHQCGHWARPSASYGSHKSQWDQMEDVSKEECWRAVKEKKMNVLGKDYDIEVGTNLKIITTRYGNRTREGSGAGDCYSTSQFVSNGVIYENSYEELLIKVLVRKVQGTKSQAKNDAEFFNGLNVRVPFDQGDRWLEHRGRLVWPTEDDLRCDEFLSSSYQGPANTHKRRGTKDRVDTIVVTGGVEAENRYIAVILGVPVRVCTKRCHVVASGYDGLVVCFFRDGLPQFKALPYRFTGLDGLQLDLDDVKSRGDAQTMQVHLQMMAMFKDLAGENCKTRRMAITNKLQAISGAKNQHALLDIYGPGYQIIPAGGAVAYILRCVPVEVVSVDFANCTAEIPVSILPQGDQPKKDRQERHEEDEEVQAALKTVLFMDPMTLILKRFPSVVPCSKAMPVMWKVVDQWYCSGAQGSYECVTPEQLPVEDESHYSSEGFLGVMKGSHLVTKEHLKARNHYVDVATADEALNSRNKHAAVDGAEGHALGGPFTAGDIMKVGSVVMLFMTPLALIWAFGSYANVVLAWGTFSAFCLTMLSLISRTAREFKIHGWDGGRTVVRAFYAFVGVATSPLTWAKRRAEAMMEEGLEAASPSIKKIKDDTEEPELKEVKVEKAKPSAPEPLRLALEDKRAITEAIMKEVHAMAPKKATTKVVAKRVQPPPDYGQAAQGALVPNNYYRGDYDRRYDQGYPY